MAERPTPEAIEAAERARLVNAVREFLPPLQAIADREGMAFAIAALFHAATWHLGSLGAEALREALAEAARRADLIAFAFADAPEAFEAHA